MADMYNHSTNSTLTTGHHHTISNQPHWTPLSVFELAAAIGTLLTSIPTLILFVRNETVRTGKFNLYLMALLAANIVHSLTVGFFGVIASIYKRWPLGTVGCNFYTYCLWLLPAFILQIHMAVTYNRVWALFFPHHYRTYHKKVRVVWHCIAALMFLVTILTPFMLMDWLWYRNKDVAEYCGVNFEIMSQVHYGRSIQVIFFNLPCGMIIGIYPVLVWQYYRQRRNVGPTEGSVQNAPNGAPSAGKARQAAANARHRQGFIVLTLLSASILICWVPSKIYYTMIMFHGIIPSEELWDAGAVGLALQALLDPLFFVLAIRELRDDAMNWLKKLCPRRAQTAEKS